MGETLGFVGKQRTVLSGVRDVDGHHTAGGGFEVVVGPAGELDALAGVLQQLVLAHLEFDEMVEMHGVEQAFDDREAVDVHGAEGRVAGRASRSDELRPGRCGTAPRSLGSAPPVAASWSKPRLADSV